MNILLSGGGTLGSVTPLLALVEELRAQEEHQFLWLGTRHGPEKVLVEEWNVQFKSIFAGKLRRYFAWQNFFDIVGLFLGLLQSIYFLKKFKIQRVLTAGSYVAVPVVLAAWLLRIPVLVHQQDLQWGLANKLMRPFATWITVNFDCILQTLPRRFRQQAFLVGNPVRQQIKDLLTAPKDKEVLFKKFNLELEVPVLLVLGGGTGALHLNELVAAAMPNLYQFCQVLHLTGKEKKAPLTEGEWQKRYHWQEFIIKDMPDVYSVADLVISRAGIGTLSELAVLDKPALVVPMPHSHQEVNAKYFADNQAAIVLDQENLAPEMLAQIVARVLSHHDEQGILSENIKKLANLDAAKEIVELIK